LQAEGVVAEARVQSVSKVHVAEVAATLPHGHAHVTVVVGGLELLNEDGSDGTLIANAIITVSIDDGQ
jgi:Conserved hypothetical protein (Lin0512_fam)